MKYYYSYYDTGEIYIAACEDDELYADVTICLAEYGITLEENQIIIPFDNMSEMDYQMYLEDLTKNQIKTVRYGPYGSIAVLAELKDDWKNICVPMSLETE